jgi:ubiquinone/menaquinone biosynthesis C-methylase UbiE
VSAHRPRATCRGGPAIAADSHPTSTSGADAPSPADGPTHEIPRYDDLAYRDVFWKDRHYEDRADRTAIRALLPPRGERIADVGAGYGRLAREYLGYREITLLDPSEAHVAAAVEQYRGEPRIRVLRGDAYDLPFEDGSLDALVCVRVMHHLEDPVAVFREFARVLRPGGTLVLEFANKRNLKSIARWAIRRQSWSPWTLEPFEYRPLHFDRHPGKVNRQLRAAGLRVDRRLAASLFRFPLLSRHVRPGLLAAVERPLQYLLGPLAPGPSVFVRARRQG